MLKVSTINWGKNVQGQKWENDAAFPCKRTQPHLDFDEAVITLKKWASANYYVCAGGGPNTSGFSFAIRLRWKPPSPSYTWFGKVTRVHVCMCRFHKSSVERAWIIEKQAGSQPSGLDSHTQPPHHHHHHLICIFLIEWPHSRFCCFFSRVWLFSPLFCHISFLDTTVSHWFVPGVYRIIGIFVHRESWSQSILFYSLFLSKNHPFNTWVGISGCLFEKNVKLASGELEEVCVQAVVLAGFSHVHLFVVCCYAIDCLSHIDFLFLELWFLFSLTKDRTIIINNIYSWVMSALDPQ